MNTHLVHLGAAALHAAADTLETAPAGPLKLETADMAMHLRVEEGRLLMNHFGSRLAHNANLVKRGHPAFPTQWDNHGGESAIAVFQPDGMPSLDLRYDSHRLISRDDHCERWTFKLKDPLHPIHVDLHLSILESGWNRKWSTRSLNFMNTTQKYQSAVLRMINILP